MFLRPLIVHTNNPTTSEHVLKDLELGQHVENKQLSHYVCMENKKEEKVLLDLPATEQRH